MHGMRVKSHRPVVRMPQNMNEPTWKTGGYRPFYSAFERPVAQEPHLRLVPQPVVGESSPEGKKVTATAKAKAKAKPAKRKAAAAESSVPKARKTARKTTASRAR